MSIRMTSLDSRPGRGYGEIQVFDGNTRLGDNDMRKMLKKTVLSIIDRSSICTEDTVVIVESSLDTEIPDFEKLKVIRVKEYKTNKHTFLMKTVED